MTTSTTQLPIEPFDQIKADIDSLVKPALGLKIEQASDVEVAMMTIKEVKSLEKMIEQRRTEIVKPMNEEVKRINNLAKSVFHPLEKAEKHLKKELIEWDNKLEAIRETERKRAQELYEKEKAALREKEDQLATEQLFGDQNLFKEEALIDEAKVIARQNYGADLKAADAIKVSGTQTFWDFEILDESLIPREYFVLDKSLIRAAISAGKRDILGVKIFQNKRLAVR